MKERKITFENKKQADDTYIFIIDNLVNFKFNSPDNISSVNMNIVCSDKDYNKIQDFINSGYKEK